MENNLIPISPAQLGKIRKVTKATVCNWLREGKDIPGVQNHERMGNRWIIYVTAEVLKES